MYPTTILLMLGAVVGLVTAAVLPPLPAVDPIPDVCLDPLSKFLYSDIPENFIKCGVCGVTSLGKAIIAYATNPDMPHAEETYAHEMAVCRGPNDDAKYELCLHNANTIVALQPVPGEIVQCTVCVATSLLAGIGWYDGTKAGTEKMLETYRAAMAVCYVVS